MKLFFETALQPWFFLLTLPIGFLICFFLDMRTFSHWVSLILDLSVLLLGTIALIGSLLVSNEKSLRLYHLLGLVTGGILYTGGIGKVRRLFRKGLRSRKKDSQSVMQK